MLLEKQITLVYYCSTLPGGKQEHGHCMQFPCSLPHALTSPGGGWSGGGGWLVDSLSLIVLTVIVGLPPAYLNRQDRWDLPNPSATPPTPTGMGELKPGKH